MSIRDRISKQAKTAMAVAFGAWLFFAIFGVLGAKDLNPLVGLAGFVVFGGSVVYALLFIKCPRCGFKLGQSGINMSFKKSGAQAINFCAHCGVSFDEKL